MQRYVCTYEDCAEPDRLSATQRDWEKHEALRHRPKWTCSHPEHGMNVWYSSEEFKTRLPNEDGQPLSPSDIEAILEMRNSTYEDPRDTCPFYGMTKLLRSYGLPSRVSRVKDPPKDIVG